MEGKIKNDVSVDEVSRYKNETEADEGKSIKDTQSIFCRFVSSAKEDRVHHPKDKPKQQIKRMHN